jgi:Sulfotransferase domain
MIYGFKKILKYALGKDIAGRYLSVYPDDTFIVSYPRSGNTWTRFLVANLLHPEQPATFDNIESLVPDTEAQSNRMLKRVSRPRFIKSHEYFDHRYRRVIYIVRDPRDVALSYYHFDRKYGHIRDDYPLESFVEDFVNGRLTSLDWGTWAENVASWIYTRGQSKNFLLLRYEEMIADTPGQLARLAAFLGVDADRERLATTIERSSLQRMRQLEKVSEDKWVSTRNKRKDIPFVRTGSVGGWVSCLPPLCVAAIESAWRPLLNSLGYPLVSAAVTHESTFHMAAGAIKTPSILNRLPE